MTESHPAFATLLTPTVPAAIAVIEVSGHKAIEMVCRLWRPNLGTTSLADHQIRYGTFAIELKPGERSEESVILHKKSETTIEIHCHGGPTISRAILRSLSQCGVIERSVHDWLAANVGDAIAVQATEDLMKSSTWRTAVHLMAQRNGALKNAVNTIRSHVQNGDREEALQKLAELERVQEIGMHLVNPWRVLLAGPPNVGKSSLLNRLLGYTRAIVHEHAGTTRDLLQEITSIDGWPITLIDSAGLRETSNRVEAHGVERTLKSLESSDKILVLVDPIEGWTGLHESIHSKYRDRCILVSTKSDLSSSQSHSEALKHTCVHVSAVTGDGMQELMLQLVRSIVPFDLSNNEPMPFRPEHIEQLRSLRTEIVARLSES